MISNDLDEEDHFFHCTRRPGMSDFERISYLRRLAATIGAKLEKLGGDPAKKGDAVAFEEALLLSAQKELRKLESRLFMV